MSQPLKVFIGYDPRQPVAVQVLTHSIYTRSSVPVSIQPLVLSTLPIRRRGLTEFTYSRYLIPWLMEFRGRGLFLDADMLMLGDVKELFDVASDPFASVFLVKGKQKFEWPSLMLFNCDHFDCKKLTPKYIDDVSSKPQTFNWTEHVTELPGEWNHCVGYDDHNPQAKLIHYTAGIPCWPETNACDYAQEWNKEAWKANSSVSFNELMGTSVHLKHAKGLKL